MMYLSALVRSDFCWAKMRCGSGRLEEAKRELCSKLQPSFNRQKKPM